jgi:hypothetical protein
VFGFLKRKPYLRNVPNLENIQIKKWLRFLKKVQNSNHSNFEFLENV